MGKAVKIFGHWMLHHSEQRTKRFKNMMALCVCVRENVDFFFIENCKCFSNLTLLHKHTQSTKLETFNVENARMSMRKDQK